MSTDLETASERFDEALVNLLDMNGVLREDLSALLDAFPDHSNPVLRRSVVRASWAYVEAITHALKHMTLILVDAGACEVELKDMAFLKNQRVGALMNVEETIKLVAKVFKVPERNLGDGTDWRYIEPSIKVRNRLVHPKNVESLQVADSEWETHKQGFKWLVHAFDGLLTDICDKYRQSHGCTTTPKT